MTRTRGLGIALGLVGLGLLLLDPGLMVLVAVLAICIAPTLRPAFAIPLLMLTLPFYLRPLRLLGLELSVTELALAATTAGLVGRAGYERIARRPHPTSLPASTADWIAAAFLLAGLLSLLPTEYMKQSLRELRWLIIEPILAFYVVRITVRSDQSVLSTLWALVLAGLLAALVALTELLRAGALVDLTIRPSGPYFSPNHLALLLERTAAVSLALGLFAPIPRVGLGAFVLTALTVLRTLSLGAWLGLGVASLSLLALRSRRWAAGAGVGLAVALALAVAFLPPERTLERFSPEHGTALFRVEIWTASLHMLADHPVLGVGLDNFLYQYRNRYMLPEAWEEPNISHPHNWVLNFWLALGLPGLAAAVASIGWIAAHAHRRLRHPTGPSDRPLGAASLGLLLTLLIHGSLDNSYFLVDLAMLWWVFLGLLARPNPASAAGGPVR